MLVVKPRPPRQNIRFDRLINSEPLELEYLATVLDRHEVRLLNGVTDRRAPEAVARAFRPQVVLFTAYVTDIPAVLAAAQRLKRLPDAPLVFVGGVYAEVAPAHFYADGIDGVFFAGQLAGIAAALDRLARGEEFRDVPGASFRHGDGFRANPCADAGIHTLPTPRRVLLEQQPRAFRYLHYRNCASVKTSFGCPGRCTFCFCRRMNGGRYTARPLAEVLDEIEALPTDTVFLVDDNFLVETERLQEFCDGVQARGLRKRFIAYGTAHFIARHPEVMRRLREAGLRGLIVGFEFVTDAALAGVGKAGSAADNDATVAICRELEIDLFALFIVDPQWRAAEFRQLAAYCASREVCFATFATLTRFPDSGCEPTGRERWWRYDLLRLHEEPAHMSRRRYYLWLYYLYLLPGLHPASVRRLLRRCGVGGTLRLLAAGAVTGLEYLVKLLLWR